jgi:catechol 2,3-dioxygenase-like lactoylglutathione lyase family enzyme
VLHHVTLEVGEADADRFAELLTLLGMAEVPPPPTLGPGFRWFERGGRQLHLALVAEPVAPPRGHAALIVPELESLRPRLRAAGFEVDERRPHWGAARCYVRAPGGHVLELMAAPPASAVP